MVSMHMHFFVPSASLVSLNLLSKLASRVRNHCEHERVGEKRTVLARSVA